MRKKFLLPKPALFFLSLAFLAVIAYIVVNIANQNNKIHDKNCIVQILTPEEVNQSKSIKLVGSTEYSVPSNLKDIGHVSVSQVLVIDNVAIPLCVTFDNPNTALSNIKLICSNLLNTLAETYDLDELSVANWKLYRKHMFDYLNNSENKSYTEENFEIVELKSFIDIYENSETNEKIIEQITKTKSVAALLTDGEFVYTLPFSYKYNYLQVIKDSNTALSDEMNKIEKFPSVFQWILHLFI